MVAPNLFKTCSGVSAQCPVESSIYGYRPNLAANAVLLAWFSLFLVFVLVTQYRNWTYLLALALGCIAEILGYIGRIMLWHNPYSKVGFNVQIVCLIIAPAFFAAAIYLMLKHIVLRHGPEHSMIRPHLYTWIFIACDLVSLILQGAGGGVSATANTYAKQKPGNNIALAGIVFQVFTLLVFGTMAALFFKRRSAAERTSEPKDKTIHLEHGSRYFFSALVIAYFLIIIRCCYRIAEMAKGWRNQIMRSEVDFMVLDGAMIAIALLCLAIFRPFKYLSTLKSLAVSK